METPTEFTLAEEIKQGQEIALVSEKNFELIFNGKVDARIQEVEKELKSILRKDVSDEKAYKDMKDLKNKVIVKMRTATIAKSKEMTEGYKENIKRIKEVENSIIEKVTTKLESKADTFIEKHEALKREAEEKAQAEAKEKLDNRVKELISNGIVFTGSWYGINEIQVGIQMIQEMSDDDYNDLLQKVRVQNDLNIAEIKRKDEEAKEFQRIQEQLRIENEEKERQLKEKEDALNAKLKEMADKEAEVERKIKAQQEEEARQAREEEAKKKEQEAQALRQLLKEKVLPFENLQMTYSFNNETWSRTIDNKTWSVTKEEILADVADIELIKKEMDEATLEVTKRELELEKQREEARIAKAQQEEEARKSLLNDTDLFNEYKSSLKEIQAPIVKDASIKAQIDAIANLIN